MNLVPTYGLQDGYAHETWCEKYHSYCLVTALARTSTPIPTLESTTPFTSLSYHTVPYADEWAKLAADEPDAHEWSGSRQGTRTDCHPETLPPAAVTRQRQTGILGEKAAGRQELDKKNAGPHGQPQKPAQRQAKTGPRGRQGQQTPRVPFLSVQNGALPDRSIPGMDHTTPRRRLLVVSVQHPGTGAPV